MPSYSLPSLILLPPPPRPASRGTLNAAYRPPLEAAIARLKKDGKGGDAEGEGVTLVVALTSPFLAGASPRHKTLSWPEAQTLIAGLYSLISTICAKLALPTEMHAGPGSVDVQVVLVDHDPSRSQSHSHSREVKGDFKPAIETNNTVIVDLATFASAYHPWKYIFHVNNEAGYSLLATYLKMLERVLEQPPRYEALKQDQLIVVEGGLAVNMKSLDPSQVAPQTKTYDAVSLGGTFDHLHPGHKLLLHAAVLLLNVPEKGASKPCRFIIGVSGDELLKKKKYAEFLQPWDQRVRNVIEFLSTVLRLSRKGWKKQDHDSPDDMQVVTSTEEEVVVRFREGTIEVQCVVLQDLFGPTITVQDIDVLVVSKETRSGGKAVNDKRLGLGWHPLEIFEIDVLDALDGEEGASENDKPIETQDFAAKISSTAIRKQKTEASHMRT